MLNTNKTIRRIIRDGRHCEECGHYLSDEEFDKYGSWKYNCNNCGYRYIHN